MDVGSLKVGGGFIVGDVVPYNSLEHAEGYSSEVNRDVAMWIGSGLFETRSLKLHLACIVTTNNVFGTFQISKTGLNRSNSETFPTLCYSPDLTGYIETWLVTANIVGVRRAGEVSAQQIQFAVQCIGKTSIAIVNRITIPDHTTNYAEGDEIPCNSLWDDGGSNKIKVMTGLNVVDGYGNLLIMVKDSIISTLTLWTCSLDVVSIISKAPSASSGS